MRHLAQGHLDTQIGGAGDQTSNLPVTSQPALPPELLSPTTTMLYTCLAVSESVPSSVGSECGALVAGLCIFLFLS